MNTINHSINNNVQFTALKSIIYDGKFNPDKKLLHAKVINSLANTEHFNNLFRKYNVEAEFNATAAEGSNQAKASLDLYLSEIPKSFWALIKDVLGWGKFKVHLNLTKNHNYEYDEAITKLGSSIHSETTSWPKEADKLFAEETERKAIMKQLQDRLIIHSKNEILY